MTDPAHRSVAEKLEREVEMTLSRAKEIMHQALCSRERGAGIASVAQVMRQSLMTVAAAELATMKTEDAESLLEKIEQVLVATARKFEQQAHELRGRAQAFEEQTKRMRTIAEEARAETPVAASAADAAELSRARRTNGKARRARS